MVSNQPLTVKQSHLLNGQNPIPVWGPEFEVRIEIKINAWRPSWQRGSIFCFTSLNGRDYYTLGHLIPSMYILSEKINLFTDIDIYPMWNFVDELNDAPFQLGKWCSFVMKQRKDEVTLFRKAIMGS